MLQSKTYCFCNDIYPCLIADVMAVLYNMCTQNLTKNLWTKHHWIRIVVTQFVDHFFS